MLCWSCSTTLFRRVVTRRQRLAHCGKSSPTHTSSRNGSHKGPLVAAVLAGSWRSSNYPPLTIDENALQEVVPLLCKSGAAALAWRRIKDSPLATSTAGETLRDTYRHQSLRSGIHEQYVE